VARQDASQSQTSVTGSKREAFSELALLSHVAKIASARSDVLVGPGDDCAVVRVQSESQLLLKVDQVIEGKHFAAGTPLELVARKAVARVVSDIAAMGGRPSLFLAACVLPESMSQEEATKLASSVHAWCVHFGGVCVGGDVARKASHALSLSITGVGTLEGAALLRSGAKVGDGVYVTGEIGGSFQAAATQRDGFAGGGKHLHFEPRVREALWLKAHCDVHAMMDISDGLGIDAGRIARASGAGIVIDAGAIPLSAEARDVRSAIRDGEDYELLFTASGDVPKMCAETGTRLTRIGRVVQVREEDGGAVWLQVGEQARELCERVEHAGYQHG
jgi:thiamine-monophosphate kinase